MLIESKLNRLNTLAKKGREEVLTATEQDEQRALREEYLVAFRSRFQVQLEDLGLEKREARPCPCCNVKHKH